MFLSLPTLTTVFKYFNLYYLNKVVLKFFLFIFIALCLQIGNKQNELIQT